MERRLFEDLIESDVVAHKTSQSKTIPVSLTLHAILLLVIIVVPILSPAELPEPAAAVKAFFVDPVSAPAPPPPPPPPAPKATIVKTPPKPEIDTTPKFQAPVDVPEQIKPEEGLDLGVEGGVAGGVEGGVPGGVVGGVVGGLPDAPAPVQAVRVGGQIKEPKKLKHVNPVYPDIAKQARVQGMVILECTISPQGRVTDVKVLRGLPLLDASAVEAVKQWVYTPTLLNGVPVPVIMTVTVNFKLN
ncbi:MAG TPA: TonB family protein [Vicinamibacteria bacterium]|jgi:protein TonB|nr:TonB family protein [Vicinamibacteria bacterium]